VSAPLHAGMDDVQTPRSAVGELAGFPEVACVEGSGIGPPIQAGQAKDDAPGDQGDHDEGVCLRCPNGLCKSGLTREPPAVPFQVTDEAWTQIGEALPVGGRCRYPDHFTDGVRGPELGSRRGVEGGTPKRCACAERTRRVRFAVQHQLRYLDGDDVGQFGQCVSGELVGGVEDVLAGAHCGALQVWTGTGDHGDRPGPDRC